MYDLFLVKVGLFTFFTNYESTQKTKNPLSIKLHDFSSRIYHLLEYISLEDIRVPKVPD